MSIFHRKRSLLQSQKLLRRERARRWTKIIFVIVLFGGLIYGLSALSYCSKLNIQTVLVSGNSNVSTDDVLTTVRGAIKGRNFLIFSRANILWYPKQQIVDMMKYSYSWIDTISVERVNSTTISVRIKERAPVAVWCGTSQDKPTACQLMDSQGYVFAKAPEFSGPAYVKLYGPVTFANWRGGEFYSQSGLKHILEFIKDLPEIGFQPIAVVVAGTNAYDVFMNGGARISVQDIDPVPEIISNLGSLLSQKAFAQSQLGNFSDLLYIDARFGNKLFYKFK